MLSIWLVVTQLLDDEQPSQNDDAIRRHTPPWQPYYGTVVKAKFCHVRPSSLLDEGDRAINDHDTNLETKTVSSQTVRMKEKRGKVVG